jgi:hypothetical protein
MSRALHLSGTFPHRAPAFVPDAVELTLIGVTALCPAEILRR